MSTRPIQRPMPPPRMTPPQRSMGAGQPLSQRSYLPQQQQQFSYAPTANGHYNGARDVPSSPETTPSAHASSTRKRTSQPSPNSHTASVEADSDDDAHSMDDDSEPWNKRLYRLFMDLRLDLVLKIFLAIILALILLRYGWIAVEDQNKFSHFTIVALLRDMTPATQQNDRHMFAVQWTSLMSWSELVVGSNMIVFVDTQASCDYLQSFIRGLQCFPVPCWNNDYNKPYLNCIFDKAHQHAPTELIAYVNGDILLDKSLATTIDYVNSRYEHFVLVGRRIDTVLSAQLLEEYRTPGYLQRVRDFAMSNGQLHYGHPIDLFVYKRRTLQELQFPPFIAGVYRWDQWLLAQLILGDHVDTFDITNTVTLIHIDKSKSQHSARAGSAHNDQIVKQLGGNTYKIGMIENTKYAVQGTICPDCHVMPNPNITDLVTFTKRASKEGYLVVLTVNSGYVPLALNWVCWAERIKFQNYILISEDKAAARKFQARNIPVIIRANAPEIKQAADYGSVAFQETMTFRTEFLMSVLNAGFHFVTADMDGLWLQDPIPYFNHASDLQGQMHKETKISGGFVVVRATTYGKYFWNKVIECQRENAAFLAANEVGTYEPSKYTEQYCVNELSRGLATQPLFSRSLLDPFVFPDGKSFFDEHQSQLRGIAPAIIHNNWIKGAENKLARMKNWGLISADEDLEDCVVIDTVPPPAATADGSNDKIDIRLRIMTFNRPQSLSRLLESLDATDFGGDRVLMEISVDHPVPSPDGEDVTKWKETIGVAESFVWRHGEKVVVKQDMNIGLVGQWTKGWKPAADNDHEFCMFLEDDVAVSPLWYGWIKKSIRDFYLDKKNYDPRMYGISLQRQLTILGETHLQRYGSRNPVDVLRKKEYLYRYQLLGTWGTLFFPTHWRQFLSWLDANNVDTISGTSPHTQSMCADAAE